MFCYNLPQHDPHRAILEIARFIEAMPANLMRFSGFDADAKKYVVASPKIQRLTAGYNCQLLSTHCLPCHFTTDSALLEGPMAIDPVSSPLLE